MRSGGVRGLVLKKFMRMRMVVGRGRSMRVCLRRCATDGEPGRNSKLV